MPDYLLGVPERQADAPSWWRPVHAVSPEERQRALEDDERAEDERAAESRSVAARRYVSAVAVPVTKE